MDENQNSAVRLTINGRPVSPLTETVASETAAMNPNEVGYIISHIKCFPYRK